ASCALHDDLATPEQVAGRDRSQEGSRVNDERPARGRASIADLDAPRVVAAGAAPAVPAGSFQERDSGICDGGTVRKAQRRTPGADLPLELHFDLSRGSARVEFDPLLPMTLGGNGHVHPLL